MGGLRAFNTDPMSVPFQEMLRDHWKHVREASGLPFSDGVFAMPGFVYDTEPPCRAVVTARTLDAAKALGLMKAVQTAFYRDARDVTKPGCLPTSPRNRATTARSSSRGWKAPRCATRTRLDFTSAQVARRLGLPDAGRGVRAQLFLVTSGSSPRTCSRSAWRDRPARARARCREVRCERPASRD
jgi:putative protein-disulfide isomerase